ncbi:MAG: amylo-alpha-1,6-glucosidase, partial [Steroidobacteraceae bacterium]
TAGVTGDGAPDQREWLEADDLGGFAMGTVSGIRTRRYHALLTVATHPPADRVVLVAALEAWIETDQGAVYLTSQRYAPDVIYPDGFRRITGFEWRPWPSWTYLVKDGLEIEHQLVCESSTGQVVVGWRLVRGGQARLAVRPLLAARDSHALQHENDACAWDATLVAGNAAWQLYPGRPGVTLLTSGRYQHDPVWYRQFSYELERERGLDHLEDLASPGVFRFELDETAPETLIVLKPGHAPFGDAAACGADLRARERERRLQIPDPIERAACAHLVRRHSGRADRGAGDGGLTMVAGYPWFTDWGRDTFIAVRGICLATGRVKEALNVLSTWADYVSEGMLPNRFPDAGETPEYNSVDAALWYIVVVGELLQLTKAAATDRRRLLDAVSAILRGYEGGTRYGIRADHDGLLAAGEPGVQLTWMDAKVGDWVVTPRIGKPVEVQALWINALAVGERIDRHWRRARERATASFLKRFPIGDGSLYDVVDVNHASGNDPAFRPNQIFAAGGLPVPLLQGAAARALVDLVEDRLWTPLGLRSLDPGHPDYRGRYQGGVTERDGAYHQGTVWPWLAGAFVEAWLNARGGTVDARAEARRRFVEPLAGYLDVAGLGSLPEIADGDAPHAPRGAPFQAWSMSELLRMQRLVGEGPSA